MKTKSLTLDEILQPGRFETDKQNYDLNEIPFNEWLDYEHLHLYIPENCPISSVSEACAWLEEFYGFKKKNFKAYITSDHYTPDSNWHPDPNKESGFYFVTGDTSDEDGLASEIYEKWVKEGKSDKDGHTKADAENQAAKILFDIEFEKEISKQEPEKEL
jgi:hypothetical protein